MIGGCYSKASGLLATTAMDATRLQADDDAEDSLRFLAGKVCRKRGS
jgi:hypothetical protein